MVRQAHHEVHAVNIAQPHPELVEEWSQEFGLFQRSAKQTPPTRPTDTLQTPLASLRHPGLAKRDPGSHDRGGDPLARLASSA